MKVQVMRLQMAKSKYLFECHRIGHEYHGSTLTNLGQFVI